MGFELMPIRLKTDGSVDIPRGRKTAYIYLAAVDLAINGEFDRPDQDTLSPEERMDPFLSNIMDKCTVLREMLEESHAAILGLLHGEIEDEILASLLEKHFKILKKHFLSQ